MSRLASMYKANLRKIAEIEDDEERAKAYDRNEGQYEDACDRAFEQARERNLS